MYDMMPVGDETFRTLRSGTRADSVMLPPVQLRGMAVEGILLHVCRLTAASANDEIFVRLITLIRRFSWNEKNHVFWHCA